MMCFDFFARVVIFCGLCYFVGYHTQGISNERVTLQQEGQDSPTRYSKTFGREKALDKLLTQADDQELLANLSGKSTNEKSDKSNHPLSELESQPGFTKKQ